MTGISQYGPPPCRCGPRGARSRETGLRANAASAPQGTRKDHVSARFIRCLAAVALGVVPTHAGAQSPPAPEVLRVTRTADDDGEGSLRSAIAGNNAAPAPMRARPHAAAPAPH